MSILEEHVKRFNAGVRSGDFTPMLENFGDDATMTFEGVPVGPFAGRDEIAQAYRDQLRTTSSTFSTRGATAIRSSPATRGAANRTCAPASCG